MEFRGLLGLDDSEEYDDDEMMSIGYEDYPGYHEEPQELISDSDTSECRHTGNGTPCRYLLSLDPKYSHMEGMSVSVFSLTNANLVFVDVFTRTTEYIFYPVAGGVTRICLC